MRTSLVRTRLPEVKVAQIHDDWLQAEHRPGNKDPDTNKIIQAIEPTKELMLHDSSQDFPLANNAAISQRSETFKLGQHSQ